MKGWIYRVSLLAVAGVLAGLAACSDGDGKKDDSPSPAAATPVIASGVITGLGSVFVNGTRYATDGASITMDDNPGNPLQLRVGQYVELQGHQHGDGSHDAEVIRYHNVLEGPITSIDLAAGSFVALGQTVRVTLDTVFGDGVVPASIAGLATGDVVEVSGIVPADGLIDATRIDIKPDGGPYDVSGYVSTVLPAGKRFNVNDLVVDYSVANMADFPSGDPAPGDLVKVTGSAFLADGALVALHVELRSDDYLAAGPGEIVEIEGEIEEFQTAADFRVAGWDVTATATTSYEHGTAADLADGVLVRVKGVADAGGRLIALKIAFREVSTIRLVAQVEAVAAPATLELLGVDVTVTGTTVFQDRSALALREFDLADLAVGDWLDVRGYEPPEAPGTVIATHVERIDPVNLVQVRGPFLDPARPAFKVFTVPVTTTDVTRFVLEQDVNTRLTADEFFSLAPGEIVEAWGTWTGALIAAERVAIRIEEVTE